MSDILRRRRNLASEEEALRPLVQLLEVPGQMVELPLQEREPMTNWWSPRGRLGMRRLHRAQRDVRDCAEGDALESQSRSHDRRRMVERVNLRPMSSDSSQ